MNTKLALAILHAGVGMWQINSIFSTLNIPVVNHAMLVRRQNEAGQAVEIVANESAEMYMQEELKLNKDTQNNEIEVSVDAGWQKRGSGKAYDSLSGHCSMIGVQTGKVLSYEVRSKMCRVCNSHKKKGTKGTCREHDCRKNWSGSAKAMEPDMVADMINKTAEKGILVTGVVGDDDTTTASRLRSTLSHFIEKKSDKNHVTKNLTNHLFSLQSQFKILSTRVIAYLLKLFNYCISQNKNNPVGLSHGLDAVVNHPFGDHTFCDETWCKFLRNPNSRYCALPYGKPLKDHNLHIALKDVFGAYKKLSDKLSKLGSTQANESLNRSIASKAPKHLHLSGSASLNFRVAASVAQKNLGHGYLSNVNKKLGVSPGTYTTKLSIIRDLQYKKKKAIAITRAAKQRRIALKQERHSKDATLEVREGPTYGNNIAAQDVDLTAIPPPLPKPVPEQLDTAGRERVYFDLETTGLERTSHIIQIAAVHGSDKFCEHVMPKKKISDKASEVAGVRVVGENMFYKGQSVETVSISSALDGFFTFLQRCRKNGTPVILVGHNIESFDCKILIHAVHSCGKYSALQQNVYGFMDTYKVFKKSHKDLHSYRQEELVKVLLGECYSAHSALEDVIALQRLLTSVQINEQIIRESSFSFERAVHSYDYAHNISTNTMSFQSMVDKKVISKGIARSMAGSGLQFCHLCVVSKRDGVDGLRQLLSEKSNGKVRVTRSERIIQAIAEYVHQFQI